jgi:Putative TM nitroreductase
MAPTTPDDAGTLDPLSEKRLVASVGGMGSSPVAPLTRPQVEQVIAAAIAAPSVLNTQPWRFHAHDDVIDVHAIPSRGLPAVDPSAREAHISCGAALLNLRLAIAAAGRTPIVRLLPDPENRAHMARERVGGPMTQSPTNAGSPTRSLTAAQVDRPSRTIRSGCTSSTRWLPLRTWRERA